MIMIRRNILPVTLPGFAALLFLSSVFAQSGRQVPPTPTPTPQPEPSASPASRPAKTYPPCEGGLEPILVTLPLKIEKFSDEINRYGSCGYRVEKVVRLALASDISILDMELSAILRLEPGSRYEYAWFIAKRPGEAQTLANDLAAENFYFRASRSFVFQACGESAARQKKENDESGPLGSLMNMAIGEMGAFFLFERKSGVEKRNEYKVLNARISGKGGELQENIRLMGLQMVKGFRPLDLWYTGFFNTHFIILEKDPSIQPEKGEYKFVSHYYGMSGEFRKLGRVGYRPVLMGYGFAMLHRRDEQPTGLEYETFDELPEIPKKTKSWAGRNVSFVTTGISNMSVNCDPFHGRFLMELTTKGTPIRKELKFLSYSDFVEQYFRQKGWILSNKIPVTDEQKEEIRRAFNTEVNRHAKEGFTIVEWAYPFGMVMLLERPL
jgi:hypothetical protein